MIFRNELQNICIKITPDTILFDLRLSYIKQTYVRVNSVCFHIIYCY